MSAKSSLRNKTLLLGLLLAVMLSGCAKNTSDDTNAGEEYPKIISLDNELYYGTDEKCEAVPRRMPDGIIETYVAKEIMPDAYSAANFGSDKEQVEYMFLEDGRMIVHVGADWFYFEKQTGSVGLANPWTDSDRQGVLAATGFDMAAPEDATDVRYSYCADLNLAQMTYTENGAEWTYRVQATAEAEDISGMYYDWSLTETGTVSGKEAQFLIYTDATEDTEYIDSVYGVQVVNWFDPVAGVSYSLSASGVDLNGMDIQVYAENLYNPAQGDATDDPQKDAEKELNDYFLGEHVRSEDESSIVISEGKDGKFDVDISIVRLCSLENGIGTFENHVMYVTVADPNGNDLQGRIYLDSGNTLIFEITDSTWDYLPTGEKLYGFGK